MGASAFQQGQAVTMTGARYTLLRKVTDSIWQLEDVRTKRIIERTDMDLRSDYTKGNLTFHNDALPITRMGKVHRDVSPEKLEVAKIKRMYVEASLDLPATGNVLESVIDKVWQKLKYPAKRPTWRSLINWRKRYLAAGRDIHALVSFDERKGNRSRRYDDAVIEQVEKTIDRVFLNRERKTIEATTEMAMLAVENENQLRVVSEQLKLPTRRLVKRIIELIPAFDKSVCRDGRTAAIRKFRSVQGHKLTNAPLERVEVDHTVLDLFVIDEENGLPLGRPYLTVCIDVNTRCVLGMHIGFDPPSFMTVAKCMRHAFLPKTNLRELYPKIKNEWWAHGVMRQFVVDNGPEFHSAGLEEACLSLGIELHYSPRKQPWFKPHIERFFRTMQSDLTHGIPGTTFSNIFEKDDYDPQKQSVVRLSTLKYLVNLWIADYYHQKPHRSLHATPAETWQSRISIDEIKVPDDPELLDAILGKPDTRVLSHKGIEYDGLFYNSPELTQLRYELGETMDVEIRVDDSNVDTIFVFSPDMKRRFKVPAINQKYAAGLTRWQHSVIKRYAREHLNSHNPLTWIRAKQDIYDLIAEEISLKKRKKARVNSERFKARGGTSTKEPLRPAPKDDHVDTPDVRSPTPPVSAGNKAFKAVFTERTNA